MKKPGFLKNRVSAAIDDFKKGIKECY